MLFVENIFSKNFVLMCRTLWKRHTSTTLGFRCRQMQNFECQVWYAKVVLNLCDCGQTKKDPLLCTKLLWFGVNHPTIIDDCYFCVTKIIGINHQNCSKWIYPNLKSAIKPVLSVTHQHHSSHVHLWKVQTSPADRPKTTAVVATLIWIATVVSDH